ncbi:MAG: dUTP diphosphatase [Acutalibacteraceae bacterium]
MNNYDVKIKKLNNDAVIPTYGSQFAAGADLYACLPEPLTIEPNETKFVHTGLSVELPIGFAGLVYARSGLACKRGLAPANKVGVIDCDYRGEIMVALHNHGKTAQTVENGERIAQLVITPYITANFIESDELSDTVRGEGGFGSTGRMAAEK